MKLAVLALFATTAAAEPREKPRFTVACDHDGWTCYDGFPAISADGQTFANVITRGERLVTEFISAASGRVLRRAIAFDAGQSKIPTVDRVAKLHRELRDFRSLSLEHQDTEHDIWVYKLGTVTLTITYCEREDCRTSYRVTRRRR
jgi:hypothetical protein